MRSLILVSSIVTILLLFSSASFPQAVQGGTATVDGTIVESVNSSQKTGVVESTPFGGLNSKAQDIVGDTSNSNSAQGRAKGNSYRVDTDVVLDEAEFWLTFSTTQTLTFYVFESTVEFGTYTEIHRNSSTVTGTGSDWYSSGPLSVQLLSGNHYIIAVSWDGTVTYYFDTGDTQATSFGAYVHGYATGYDPLPSSISSTVNDQAIYHQRLTTNTGPQDPVVDVKVNGSDTYITISQGQGVTLTGSIVANSAAGQDFDTWIVVNTQWGWFSYQGTTWYWDNLYPTHAYQTGALADWSGTPLTGIVPTGYYKAFIGIEQPADGSLFPWPPTTQYVDVVDFDVVP